MTRLTLVSIAALALAAVVAWRLGGTAGGGVLAGALLGVSFTGLGALHLRHTIRTRPERGLAAFGLSFLFKLAIVVAGALAFRYVDAAALRADWRTFLIAFAACAALLVPLGALDALRGAQERGAH
jgi:hypothetical protein